MDPTIRPALVADTAAIGTVQVRAWQAAYRGAMPDAYLDGLDPAQRAAMWVDLLRREDDTRRLVVAEAHGSVVGFAAFGPARDDPVDGELYALNVDPDEWGQGHGPRLLREATTWLGAAGYAEAVLFVVVQNERARRMYEADGWALDGPEIVADALGVSVPEVRYRRALPS